MTLRKKFKPYSPTKDVIFKNVPNVAADILMGVVSSIAEVQGKTEAEVVAEIAEREGVRAYGQKNYDLDVKAGTTKDNLLKKARSVPAPSSDLR